MFISINLSPKEREDLLSNQLDLSPGLSEEQLNTAAQLFGQAIERMNTEYFNPSTEHMEETGVHDGSPTSPIKLRNALPTMVFDALDEGPRETLRDAVAREEEIRREEEVVVRPVLGPLPPTPTATPPAEPVKDPYRHEPWKTGAIVGASFFGAGLAGIGIATGLAAIGIGTLVTCQAAAIGMWAGVAAVCCTTPIGAIALGVIVLATALALIIQACRKHKAKKAAARNRSAATSSLAPAAHPPPKRQRSKTSIRVGSGRVLRFGEAIAGRPVSKTMKTDALKSMFEQHRQHLPEMSQETSRGPGQK